MLHSVKIVIAKVIVPDILDHPTRLQSFKPSHTAINERFILRIGHMDINARVDPSRYWARVTARPGVGTVVI